MQPPHLAEKDTHIFFEREFRGETVVLYFLNGDSYDMSVDELTQWLRQQDIDEGVLDYVWGFYTVEMHVPSGNYQWVSREDLYKAVNVEPLNIGIL